MPLLVALMLLGQGPPTEAPEVTFVLHNTSAAPIAVVLRHDFERTDLWRMAAGESVHFTSRIEGKDFLVAEVRGPRAEVRLFPIPLLLATREEGRIEIDIGDDRAVWRARLRRGAFGHEQVEDGGAEAVVDVPVRLPALACLSFHGDVDGFGPVELTDEPHLSLGHRPGEPIWRRLRARGAAHGDRWGRWYLAPDGAFHLSWFNGLHGPTISVPRFLRSMTSAVVMHSDDGPSSQELGPVEIRAEACPPRSPPSQEKPRVGAGG